MSGMLINNFLYIVVLKIAQYQIKIVNIFIAKLRSITSLREFLFYLLEVEEN